MKLTANLTLYDCEFILILLREIMVNQWRRSIYEGLLSFQMTFIQFIEPH